MQPRKRPHGERSPAHDSGGKKCKASSPICSPEKELQNETGLDQVRREEGPENSAESEREDEHVDIERDQPTTWVLVGKNPAKVYPQKFVVSRVEEVVSDNSDVVEAVRTLVSADDLRVEREAGRVVFYTRQTSAVHDLLNASTNKERKLLRGGKWYAVVHSIATSAGVLLIETVGQAFCRLCDKESAERCACKGACFRCGKHDHEVAKCTGARQCRSCATSGSPTCSHISCFLCGQLGHFGRECQAGVEKGPCTLVIMDLLPADTEALVGMVVEKYKDLLNPRQAEGGVKIWTAFGRGKAAVYFKSRVGALTVKNALCTISFASEGGEVLHPRIEEAASSRNQQHRSQPGQHQASQSQSQRNQPAQHPRPNVAPQQPPSRAPWHNPQAPFVTPQYAANDAAWPSLSTISPDSPMMTNMMAMLTELTQNMMTKMFADLMDNMKSMQQEILHLRSQIAVPLATPPSQDDGVFLSQPVYNSNSPDLATAALVQENASLKEQIRLLQQQGRQLPASTPVRNLSNQHKPNGKAPKPSGC